MFSNIFNTKTFISMKNRVYGKMSIYVLIYILLSINFIHSNLSYALPLKQEHVNAIILMLEAFNVNQSIVEQVRNILITNNKKDKDTDDNINKAPMADKDVATQNVLHDNNCVDISGISRTLGFGTLGSDVKKLQEFLKWLGLYKYHTTTGYFGKITEQAVIDFQKRYGIVSGNVNTFTGLGVVDTKTLSYMKSLCNTSKNNLNDNKIDSDIGNNSTNCPQEYRPVCALLSNKEPVKTFSNVCKAQKNTTRIVYHDKCLYDINDIDWVWEDDTYNFLTNLKWKPIENDSYKYFNMEEIVKPLAGLGALPIDSNYIRRDGGRFAKYIWIVKNNNGQLVHIRNKEQLLGTFDNVIDNEHKARVILKALRGNEIQALVSWAKNSNNFFILAYTQKRYGCSDHRPRHKIFKISKNAVITEVATELLPALPQGYINACID